jgi:mannose-6-phosphate isomerase-like protein (cupin superfamily)
MEMRRVVTSNAGGTPSFVSDERLTAVSPPLLGNEIARIWGFDDTPRLPSETEPQPSEAAFFPPPGGFRLVMWTLPADGALERPTGDAYAAARQEMERIVPGMADVEYSSEGMHSTSTVDCEYVVSGEVTLVLEGGASTILEAGDIAVVNGCPHAWRNEGGGPCVLLAVLLGALPPAQ